MSTEIRDLEVILLFRNLLAKKRSLMKQREEK